MIEELIPLESIPPGIVTNGSLFDRTGRWANGNLVRFRNGYPEALGEVGTLSLSATPPVGGTPSGAFIWTTANGSTYVACGKGSKLYVIKRNTSPPHTMTNITPAGILTLNGTANGWSFASLGDVLLASRSGPTGDKLWSWDPNVGGLATVVNNSPSSPRGVFVTPEQFIVVLTGARDIKWASQGTLTTWAPLSTNSAGGLTIPSVSSLVAGRKVRGQSLLWSEDDVWSLDYVGAPLYYGSALLGAGAGLVGANAVAVTKDTVIWMGSGAFFKYDGYVQHLDCDISETIFTNNMARGFGPRFFALVNAPFNEVWWFYCSGVFNTTPDKMAIYNYANGSWSPGVLSRAAGCDALWHDAASDEHISPLLFDADGTTVYQHEIHQVGTSVLAGGYVESGPFLLGKGDQTVLVQKLVPDFTGFQPGDSISVFSGLYPNDGSAESTTAVPFDVLVAPPFDVRFRARYIRWKQTLVTSQSRIGIPKLGIIPSSKR